MSRSSPVEVYEPDTLNNINPENISQAEYVDIFLALPFNTQSEGSCKKARRYSSIGG